MPGFISAPVFNTRVPVQFISLDIPQYSITAANKNLLLNNPKMFNVNAGSVMKIDQGTDGLNYFRGDTEFAPLSLELEWDELGLNDYIKLANLRTLYTTFISYRNIGYYGKLILPGPKSSGNKVQDVLKVSAQFMVLAPSDTGGAAACSRLISPPSFTAQNGAANSGYLSSGITQYYWLTFATKYGETLPTALNSTGIKPSSGNTANFFNWNWPSYTSYIESASLYVSTANNPSTSRLLGDVPYGLPSTYVDYVGYQGSLVNRQPPTSSMAFRGQWLGGLWYNETTTAS